MLKIVGSSGRMRWLNAAQARKYITTPLAAVSAHAPPKHTFKRHLSTSQNHFREWVDEQNASSYTYLTSKLKASDPISHEVYSYKVDFEATCSDVQFAQEGAYLEITNAEMEKYFPEGLAGEMKEEITDTGRNAWMVRNTGKVLCRVIEDFEHNMKYGSSAPIPEEGLRFPVELHDLTDGPALWDNSKFQVFSYSNKNLIDVQDPVKKGLKVVRGPESIVEKTLEAVRNQNNGSLPSKIMLAGERGVGKSAALCHAVYHARKRGWICVYIPKGYDQVNGGLFIEPVSNTTGETDLFDNTMMSAAALRNLWKAHHHELKDIPIRNRERINKYTGAVYKLREAIQREVKGAELAARKFTELRANEIGEEDTFWEEDILDSPIIDDMNNFNIHTFELNTLEDLCLMGIAFRDYAGISFVDVLEELRAMDDPNRPVLIAIDEVNYWDMPTVYQYHGRKIRSPDMCVPHATKFLSPRKSDNDSVMGKHVLCIGATSMRYPAKKTDMVTYMNCRSSLPFTIKVPSYTHVEFLAAMKYYLAHNLLDRGVTNQQLLAYRMHVGNNPRLARKEATKFFLPIMADHTSRMYLTQISHGIDIVPPATDLDEIGDDKVSDMHYEVVSESTAEKVYGTHAKDIDVDISRMSQAEIEQEFNSLTDVPDLDDLKKCDASPLVSRNGDLDISDIQDLERDQDIV